jgi:hypothetical protein
LSEALAETVMVPETVAPELGDVMLTVGAVVSGTVTLTDAEVAVLPAASRATALRVWVPTEAVAVFHATEYGAVVSSAPRLAPSSRNWTPATPTLSEALAETVIVPETVAPALGEVMLTVGAVVSGGAPFETVTEEDVLLLPAASRAMAVRVWDPLLVEVVSHETE